MIVVCLAGLAGCEQLKSGGAAAPKAAAPATPVRVTPVRLEDVPLEIQAIGNAEASASVTVKSRVAGQILRVHPQDGQDVRAGDLMFEIDPQPFQEKVRQSEANLAQTRAVVRQANANLVRDQAHARQARAQAERYSALKAAGVVSSDQFEQLRATAESAEASLVADQATIESAQAAIRAEEARLADAKLQLSYTRITAPIAGRAGAVAIKAGNLIKENDLALVTLLRVTPLYVSFAIPEQNLVDVRQYLSAKKLAVEAFPNGSSASITGTLDFIDNMVDSTTGTIKMRATFVNTNRQLWPGQFARITLKLTTQHNALVVPTSAVQSSQTGRYVWVVKGDSTAEMRAVKVSRTQGALAVLGGAIQAGENVVTEGQLRLRPGIKVEMLKAAPVAAAAGATPASGAEGAR